MPEQPNNSEESLDSSGHIQEKQDSSEDDHVEENVSPNRGPRVHFRSTWNPPPSPSPPESQDEEREERKNARNEGLPHLPSHPYSHESADVTDTPLNERTEQPPEKPQDGRKESKLGVLNPKRAVPDLNPKKAVPKPTMAKMQSAGHSFMNRTRKISARLGRDEFGGDDLRPGSYNPDASAGGEDAPSRDIPGGKRRTDDENKQNKANARSEARRLVRDMTQGRSFRRREPSSRQSSQSPLGTSGRRSFDGSLGTTETRLGEGGILSQLIKLNRPEGGRQPGNRTPSDTGSLSGAVTTKKQKLKWYKKSSQNQSSTNLASGNVSGTSTPVGEEDMQVASQRHGKGRGNNERLEDEIRVTVQIAEIIARQRYIMKLCRALMRFGAPTHRMEEYMQMTARVLDVSSQYLYLPGCMIMSFDDPATRTTEVKLIRTSQAVDLARLSDTHSIYKNVTHDVIGIEEAIQELDRIMDKKPRYNKYVLVLVYGLASAAVGPFAFSARPIDLPIIFINGLILGVMRFVIAPNSVLYSNIFEVAATILTSFLARAWGSIPRNVVNGKREYIFCFSAIAQASIALILPGFLVLMGSLELQSHQIVAGSIRMVYAIIYSLFLGYGITVGTTIYGLMDAGATSDVQCQKADMGAFTNEYVSRFPFVVFMLLCLSVANQAKWKQTPPMLLIGFSGYVTNYFVTKKLGSNSQVANTVGAFTLGVLGNLYSRLWHGHAATAILPGIFVLVPSGLAASGTVVSGIQSANAIRGATQSDNGGGSGSDTGNSSAVNNLGFGMVQVAIGITVGLFIAVLLIYPYGKRRSGLFSF